MTQPRRAATVILCFVAVFVTASPVLANHLAWAWVDNPITTTTPPANKQYNSPGGTITVKRVNQGSYVVNIPHLSNPNANPLFDMRGVTHLLPVGSPGVECGINIWGAETQGDNISLSCQRGLQATDTNFVILYYKEESNASFNTGAYAHFRPDSDKPMGSTTWNSVGGLNRSRPTATGKYELTFGGLGSQRGIPLVTANDRGHCKVEHRNFGGRDLKVIVRCYSGGVPKSLRYTASFFTNTVIGAPRWQYRYGGIAHAQFPQATATYPALAPHSLSSGGQPVMVTRLGVGSYRLGFSKKQTSSGPGVVLPMAYGSGATRCWSSSSADPLAVSCDRNSEFAALYLTTKSAILPPEQRVDFSCQKNDSNEGCQTDAVCPAGTHVVKLKAACNLEYGTVSDAQVAELPPNQLRVVKPSGNVSDGQCSVGSVVRSSGAGAAGGLNYDRVRVGCREHDDNGGDCHIKGVMYCR